MVNALGCCLADIWHNLKLGCSPGMMKYITPVSQKEFHAGVVSAELPLIPDEFSDFNCRNNRLALAAIQQIESAIKDGIERYGAARVGVVIGTSTSGISEAEVAIKSHIERGVIPADYTYKKQEIGAISDFIAQYLKVEGPAYVVSTACSSSGKVFASARGLIDLDICDLVIVGGVDSLCDLTLNGFDSLEAVSNVLTNPFSVNRKGINIGEAAALFLMSKEKSSVQLLGVGESSDAHHMSAPEPSGSGAKQAMQAALKDANINKEKVDYINLHGTGTSLNDSMESHAVYDIFADQVQTSSTKPLTGHTLGAAGATEAGICWLILKHSSEQIIAPHVYDGCYDPSLSPIKLSDTSKSVLPVQVTMSNSFAFGGNNVSVILGKCLDA